MVDRTRKNVLRPKAPLEVNSYATLVKLAERVDELIKEYGKDAVIDTYSYAYEDTEYVYVFTSEPETDDEMVSRIKREEKWEADELEQDRRTLEFLQKKLNGSINDN